MAYTREIYFSQFWRLGKSKLRGRQIQCLVGAHFLVCRHQSACYVLTWVRKKHLPRVSSLKGTNTVPEGSTPVTSLPPKGPTSKYHHIGNWGVSIWIWRDTKIQSIAVSIRFHSLERLSQPPHLAFSHITQFVTSATLRLYLFASVFSVSTLEYNLWEGRALIRLTHCSLMSSLNSIYFRADTEEVFFDKWWMLGKVECRRCQISSRERGGSPGRLQKKGTSKGRKSSTTQYVHRTLSWPIHPPAIPYYPAPFIAKQCSGSLWLTVFNSSPPILSCLPPIMFLPQTTLLQLLSSRLPMISILLKSTVEFPGSSYWMDQLHLM